MDKPHYAQTTDQLAQDAHLRAVWQEVSISTQGFSFPRFLVFAEIVVRLLLGYYLPFE